MRQMMTIIKVSSKAILRNTFVFLELKDVLVVFMLKQKDPCWNKKTVSFCKCIFVPSGNTLKNDQYLLGVVQKASYVVKFMC